jgi:hypothetical protein
MVFDTSTKRRTPTRKVEKGGFQKGQNLVIDYMAAARRKQEQKREGESLDESSWMIGGILYTVGRS